MFTVLTMLAQAAPAGDPKGGGAPGGVKLFGLILMAGSGIRLLQLKSTSEDKAGNRDAVPEDAWVAIASAFDGLRTGVVPVLMAPDSAHQSTREAFTRGNEALLFLARRQKVVRAAIDDLREELHANHKYLTRSQVGLIGANSVAERLEDLDKRLAKIRSVV